MMTTLPADTILMGKFVRIGSSMRCPFMLELSCWAMLVIVLSLLGQSTPGQTGAAILHTQGGVWINGYEARDSSAVFPGDLLETKPGSSASLSLDGSTVLIQPESVAKLQTNLLELDHGSVSVGTSKSFKVKVNCLTVVPVQNEWTQYDVNNVNGKLQIAARKDDVNVERASDHSKPTPDFAAAAPSGSTSSRDGAEEFQTNRQARGVTGWSPLQPVRSGLNPKWTVRRTTLREQGRILLCVLLCGGSGGKKPPLSSSQP